MHPVAAAFWGGFSQWPPSCSLQPWSPQPGFQPGGRRRRHLFGGAGAVRPRLPSAPAHRRAGRAVASFLTHLTVLGSMGLTLATAAGAARLPQAAVEPATAAGPAGVGRRDAGSCAGWCRRAGDVAGQRLRLRLLGFGLIVLALRRPCAAPAWPGSRRRAFAGHHQPGHARLDLGARRHTTPLAVHALRALSSMAYIGIMGWAHVDALRPCAGAQAGAGPGPQLRPGHPAALARPCRAAGGPSCAAGRRIAGRGGGDAGQPGTLEAVRARRLQPCALRPAGRLRRCVSWAPARPAGR